MSTTYQKEQVKFALARLQEAAKTGDKASVTQAACDALLAGATRKTVERLIPDHLKDQGPKNQS